MVWARRFWLLLHTLFRRNRSAQRLNDEIQFHLDQQIAEHIAGGMNAQEARYAAMRTFGNPTFLKEETRDTWGWLWIEQIAQDLRYAVRILRNSPGFTTVAVLTVALGVGANTAIFSLIDTLLFKALPVENAQQLVLPNWTSHGLAESVVNSVSCDCGEQVDSGRIASSAFSYPIYRQISERSHVFSSVAAMAGNESRLNIGYKGQASRADGELVSGSFFSTLGVRPVLGRVLAPDDDRIGASPAAVISYGYWEKRFGRSPGVVGQTITIDSIRFTIVGVSPPEFYGVRTGRAVEIWLPLHAPAQVGPGEGAFESRLNWWVLVIGRMKPGMTELQTRTELEGILQQTIASDVKQTTKPETIPHLGLASASKGLNELRRDFSKPLFILMTIVGQVLLIACANVANLMLVRADTRRREIAVRQAIGAGRGRLVRQLFTESLLLAALGGAIGLLMAFWGVNLLLGFIASGPESITLNVAPDVRVLGFTIALSLLTGILFSLSPALGSMRVDLTPALKEGGRDRAMGAANRHNWFSGKSLVITQVSLSIVLLVGAGLFVRTLAKIRDVSLGFNPQNILLFGIDPAQDGYKDQRLLDFYQDLSRRIEALPGVRSVGLSILTLVGGGNSFPRTRLEDQGGNVNNRERTGANYNWVGPGFFKAMGIPLVLGRIFSETETSGQAKVAVVNEAFVRQFLANRNPIGQRFAAGDREGIEIVGIVGNAKYADLTQEVPPTAYLSYLQFPADLNPMHFEVRTASDPTEIVGEVRRIVRDMDARLALYDVKTQTEQINQALFQERLFARLTSFFGILAALLASVGIYGVMAFTVSRRTREFGIRMALGGSRGEIMAAILRETLALVGIGAGLGIAVALAASGLISTNLYAVKPDDRLTIAGSALLMMVAAALAGYIPGRRAMRVDPMVALRYE